MKLFTIIYNTQFTQFQAITHIHLSRFKWTTVKYDTSGGYHVTTSDCITWARCAAYVAPYIRVDRTYFNSLLNSAYQLAEVCTVTVIPTFFSGYLVVNITVTHFATRVVGKTIKL